MIIIIMMAMMIIIIIIIIMIVIYLSLRASQGEQFVTDGVTLVK